MAEIERTEVIFGGDLRCRSGSCYDDGPTANDALFFVIDRDGNWHPVCFAHIEGWYLDCEDFIQHPVVPVALTKPPYDVKHIHHPASPGELV